MDGRAEIHHVAVFQGDGGVAALIEAHGEACRGVQGQTVSGAQGRHGHGQDADGDHGPHADRGYHADDVLPFLCRHEKPLQADCLQGYSGGRV